MSNIFMENIWKKYGNVTAVNDISLTIEDGSFTTLLGPSGCGKTTMLRMIAGLEEPTSGSIRTDDQVFYSSDECMCLPPGKRGLGLVFQNYALWPHMTVWDNIAFGLKIQKLNQKELKNRIDSMGSLLRIDTLMNRFPSELSGGQQQRVALARVLASKPNILLLDEPLSNLDAKLRMDMRAELKRLHEDTGSTIVYVTHDQLEALTMSTMVAVMRDGRIEQYEPPLDIYRNPANVFVAEFVGNPKINMMPGKLQPESGGWILDLGFGSWLLDSASSCRPGQVLVGIRPEQIDIKENPAGRFKVFSTLPAGSETYIRVKIDDQYITVRKDGLFYIARDRNVELVFQVPAIRVFDSHGDVMGVRLKEMSV
jgi:multiple sugar transport system ATP-binding protein